jgi:hypothetical protein
MLSLEEESMTFSDRNGTQVGMKDTTWDLDLMDPEKMMHGLPVFIFCQMHSYRKEKDRRPETYLPPNDG